MTALRIPAVAGTGALGTPLPPRRFQAHSNYPAAVPRPPAAPGPQPMSPEKRQEQNAPAGGKGSLGTWPRCSGPRQPKHPFPPGTATGGGSASGSHTPQLS